MGVKLEIISDRRRKRMRITGVDFCVTVARVGVRPLLKHMKNPYGVDGAMAPSVVIEMGPKEIEGEDLMLRDKQTTAPAPVFLFSTSSNNKFIANSVNRPLPSFHSMLRHLLTRSKLEDFQGDNP